MTTLTLHLTDGQADALRTALGYELAEPGNVCSPERTGPPQPDENGTLLARKSGTAPLTILRAEVHGTDPTLETLRSWAAALDVSVADLLVDDGPEAA